MLTALSYLYAESLLGAVDRMAIDPPFLNEDCQSKGKIVKRTALMHHPQDTVGN